MALVTPYITYPKNRSKIHKLRDKFEVGRISNEHLDPYETTLVRDWMRCRTLGVDPGMREGIILPADEYETALANSRFIIEKSEPILNKVTAVDLRERTLPLNACCQGPIFGVNTLFGRFADRQGL